MSDCLCCQSTLLRHFQNQQLYWYCPSCHQAMPAAKAKVLTQSFTAALPAVSNEIVPHRTLSDPFKLELYATAVRGEGVYQR